MECLFWDKEGLFFPFREIREKENEEEMGTVKKGTWEEKKCHTGRGPGAKKPGAFREGVLRSQDYRKEMSNFKLKSVYCLQRPLQPSPLLSSSALQETTISYQFHE